jgi:transposase
VNTISKERADGRRRRRAHSDEFKADAVAACMHPGVSIAAVAMSRGINANLLRRWVKDQEQRAAGGAAAPSCSPAPTPAAFVPLPLTTPRAAPSDIRIELRRGATTIALTWPTDAAAQCAAWLRELLR